MNKQSPQGRQRFTAPTRYAATPDELLGFYRDMLLIRRFEEAAGQLYGRGQIGGFCHLYIGQEAVAVGVFAALKEGDSAITGYRDHGHALMCGATPREVMAELTGREAGISRGRGGSMHMFKPESGFFGGHGIVGAQVPLGTGIAFAHKYRNNSNICVAFFGDGAANQGQIFEAFNMAGLWKLPIVYIVENNRYAMGTSVERSSSEVQLFRRGDSFKIPGLRVNGMDVRSVKSAVDKAADWARTGQGPVLLEMETYRYRGHSMSDPAQYRSRDEVQKMRSQHDPIDLVRELLLKTSDYDEAALKQIDGEIRAQVKDASEFAQETPEPEVERLYDFVVQ